MIQAGILLGFIFTFFIPGFLIIQTFFRNLSGVYKIPLVMLISVLVSTYAVYFVSLLIGYSVISIVITIFLFAIWFVVEISKYQFSKINFKKVLVFVKDYRLALGLGIVTYLVFLTSLTPAIFTKYNGYFVMAAENWQDTALHHSIIESLSQGNSPPQAPYFSGKPLSYYYFVDFHSSIIEILSGTFFPRVLVYDNPFFALIFVLSVYALCFKISQNNLASFFASFLAIFSGSFIYIKFIKDLYLSFITQNFAIVLEGIASHKYSMDSEIVPMANYFLQNRPMMVGLPAVALIILLLLIGFDKKEYRYYLMSGVITGLLIKFQTFGLGISLVVFGIFCLVMFGYKNINRTARVIGTFFLPIVIIFAIMSVQTPTGFIIKLITGNFSWGPWESGKNFWWFFSYYIFQFGMLSLVFLAALILIYKTNQKRLTVFLLSVVGVLFIFPNIMKFTIANVDMFKFFYFMLIPVTVISGIFLANFWKRSDFKIIIIVILFLSSITAELTLAEGLVNKNEGYSVPEVEAGLWVRDNTPEKSVFVTLPTVHSSIAEVGGRLRILSYTEWPYTHGFNNGDDNVFTRQSGINNFYNNPQDFEVAMYTFNKYHINYVYLGRDEKKKYPQDDQIFRQQSYLRLVYNYQGVEIFKVL